LGISAKTAAHLVSKKGEGEKGEILKSCLRIPGQEKRTKKPPFKKGGGRGEAEKFEVAKKKKGVSW